VKIVVFNKSVEWDAGGLSLEPKVPYLLENQGVPGLLHKVKGDGEVRDANTRWRVDEMDAEPDRAWKILVVRAGGAGDILYTTPLLKELKRRYPNCKITYCAGARLPWLVAHNPSVDSFIQYPLRLSDCAGYDQILNLEGAIEGNTTDHAVDCFAKVAGITPLDRSYVLNLNPVKVGQASNFIPRHGRYRVAIQPRASSPVRTYPDSLMSQVVRELMGRDIQCVIVAEHGSIITPNDWFPKTVNLAMVKIPLSWEDSLCVVSHCDAALAVDSSLIPFASAMGKPTVGIWGSFKHDLRVMDGARHIPIYGKGVCRLAPCMHHPGCSTTFPEGGHCNVSGICEELASIKPRDIADAVEKACQP